MSEHHSFEQHQIYLTYIGPEICIKGDLYLLRKTNTIPYLPPSLIVHKNFNNRSKVHRLIFRLWENPMIFLSLGDIKYLSTSSSGSLVKGVIATVYGAHDGRFNYYAIKFQKHGKGYLDNERKVYKELKSHTPRRFGHMFSQVYRIGIHKGHDVMVLHMFERTLRQAIIEKPQLSTTACKNFGKQAITQLEILHRAGWVHRDIKPSNIMTSGQHDEYIHIIDFGIAKKYRHDNGEHFKTATDRFVGSPWYASINVLSGKRCTRRDDLDSLGCVLIQLRCGGLPWSHIPGLTKENRNAIMSAKRFHTASSLCPGFKSLESFFDHVKSLGFSEEPDYEYLKHCFDNM